MQDRIRANGTPHIRAVGAAEPTFSTDLPVNTQDHKAVSIVRASEYCEQGRDKSHAMQGTIELPKAFSVRDDREFRLVQDLVTRLNPKLLVIQVATGMHVDGGYTVNWGLVYMDGQPLADEDLQAALKDAGLDIEHNAEIQPSRIWVNNEQGRLVDPACPRPHGP